MMDIILRNIKNNLLKYQMNNDKLEKKKLFINKLNLVIIMI